MKPNKQVITAVISAALLTGSAAFGQSGDAILDLLTKKGVITQKEANDAREQLDKQTAEAVNQYNKIKVSSWVNSLTFYGDIRLRYEWRSGLGNAGLASGTGRWNGPDDNADLDRFRYRLRVGVNGELQDNFSYGVQLETGTKGNSANATSGGQGFSGSPWSKLSNDAIGLGLLWAQYKPTDWLTLIGGKMNSPFINYQMGWKDDIHPEGFAEKLQFKTEKVDYFLTLGEFIYNNVSNQNIFAGSSSPAGGNDTWLLGVQGGGKIKFTKDLSFTVAPTFYVYSNPDQANGIFAPTFTGGNIIGANNLSIFDLPAELAFQIPGLNLPGKIFGEYSLNTSADQRAAHTAYAAYENQDTAYQVGASIGNTKKKHDWLVKAYWQHVELFALDPNLVNNDYFDQRLNVEGVVSSGTYLFTDFLSATLTYAHAKNINSALPTLTGAGDLKGNLKEYNLLQADLVWKF